MNDSFFELREDFGSMYFARVSGTPMLAEFGSPNSDWSVPQEKHELCLNSSDLKCGNCLSGVYKYSDVHCLTSYSPEFVSDSSISLLKRIVKLLQ